MTEQRYQIVKLKSELISIFLYLQYKTELYPYEVSYFQWRRGEILTELQHLASKPWQVSFLSLYCPWTFRVMPRERSQTEPRRLALWALFFPPCPRRRRCQVPVSVALWHVQPLLPEVPCLWHYVGSSELLPRSAGGPKRGCGTRCKSVSGQ